MLLYILKFPFEYGSQREADAGVEPILWLLYNQIDNVRNKTYQHIIFRKLWKFIVLLNVLLSTHLCTFVSSSILDTLSWFSVTVSSSFGSYFTWDGTS